MGTFEDDVVVTPLDQGRYSSYLWDEHGLLVAYATQMMLFTYLQS